MRILNAEPLEYGAQARAILEECGEVVEQTVTRKELLALLPAFDVLIVRLGHQVDREVIDAGARLKAIVTATTGLDHLDVAYAQKKEIAVLSLRGETAFLRTVTATAEHTWALLLALVRRIPQAFSAVRAGSWERDAFRGRQLRGKGLGLLGLGRIGQMMARYGRCFEMDVVAYDPYLTASVEGVRLVDDLETLLPCCDVLSLHVPLNASTREIIGKGEVSLLPSGAVLLNTARGELVSEQALVGGLERRHLAGAAVDVVCHERVPGRRLKSPLLAYARAHDNLLITPHVAGATFESMADTEVFMARKLQAFLQRTQDSIRL